LKKEQDMQIHLSANRTKSVNSNGKVTSAVLTCHTTGADPEKYTDEEVLDEVLKFVPENLGAAQLTEASIAEYHGSGVYEIEVNYEQKSWKNTVKRSQRRARDEKWFLAVSHATEHIFIAENNRVFGKADPKVGLMIGWNGKSGSASQVTGTNILVPVIRENCVLTLPLREYNLKFRKVLLPLLGCVNSWNFHGWEKGEVLLLGASTGAPYINDDEEELIDVTMKFAIRRNRNDLLVNNVTFSAQGWDFVWPVGDENICVSQVYPTGDFNALGIGRNGY
jgi:hypothetical protein